MPTLVLQNPSTIKENPNLLLINHGTINHQQQFMAILSFNQSIG
jgi:hypothetical protein